MFNINQDDLENGLTEENLPKVLKNWLPPFMQRFVSYPTYGCLCKSYWKLMNSVPGDYLEIKQEFCAVYENFRHLCEAHIEDKINYLKEIEVLEKEKRLKELFKKEKKNVADILSV